ncbi:MAG: DivIVA domain-containing protein [Bernardetiaceae bacterium]|jgi:cell division initiation protein|nr:DivIVA domain-containing protein [Bernardetiaceae bacterium]
MKVTPLDIRKKQFEKVTFGGYNKDDVNAYMSALSQAWEQLFQRSNETETKLTATTTELNRLREMEGSLLRTIRLLEDNNHSTRENAKKEAEIIVLDARVKANQALEDARLKAKTLIRNANQQIYQSLNEMREELRKLDYSCRLLEKQRDVLINEMRTFINETVGKIEQVEAHKRTVFYEDEIKKANQMMQQANEAVRQEIREMEQLPQPEARPLNGSQQGAPAAKPLPNPPAAKPSLGSFFDTL